MRYQQLPERRSCLRDHGFSQARLAKQISIHPSTVSRELRRQRDERGYLPELAHQQTIWRRRGSKKYRGHRLREG